MLHAIRGIGSAEDQRPSSIGESRSANNPTDKTAIGRQIEATDRQIDRLVYDLYGLTDEEIKIVEEATRQ